MSAPVKTSPTPWRARSSDEIIDANGTWVLETAPRNVALVVRAVNSHEALVEALARLERRVDELLRKRLAAPMDLAGIATTAGLDDACANARAALAKAGAK